MKLSILFFAAEADATRPDPYRFVVEAARIADQCGFHAAWFPERHFHPFGGLYPSPAVIAAVVAHSTRQLRIRAGSVVLPLHHPVRVAEDWAMIDALSGGRVDLAFSKGWNQTEIVHRAHDRPYDDDRLFAEIELVRKLWAGQSLAFPTPGGGDRLLSIYPRPTRPTLDWWVSTFNENLFERVAQAGGNILTGLLLQSPAQLEARIARFRAAAAPGAQLTAMLHTFVARDGEDAKAIARPALRAYLESSVGLWRQEIDRLNYPPAMHDKILDFACARYLKESTLIGDPDEVRAQLQRFAAMGVDEVACLLDFGIPEARLLDSMQVLGEIARSID